MIHPIPIEKMKGFEDGKGPKEVKAPSTLSFRQTSNRVIVNSTRSVIHVSKLGVLKALIQDYTGKLTVPLSSNLSD